MREKHYRSIIKAISWRTVGTIDTMVISFFITGNLVWAISIGSLEVFTKMVLYYLHERAWDKTNFGREKIAYNDYQI
ncbi:DUF2061 domain-containing protein [Sulfuricurvum sp.]|uniref:DUF2061 domain-containing protein n=1 Tax=Sulfuricurvum sp. TaxID=2025608 RepID=UPI0035693B6D